MIDPIIESLNKTSGSEALELPPSYEAVLKTLVQTDERFMVMTAENRAPVRGLPAAIRERFIDTGITEQCMIGAAAGLALRGRIPVVHALATFLTLRAFEFIRTDVGIANLPVKMVGWVPGLMSDANGPTHQAIEDVSILRGIPPVQVFCPADEQDLLIGIEKILKAPEPYYVRYCNRKAVVAHSRNFEIGKAEVFEETPKGLLDVAIITYGTLFSESYMAKKILEEAGLSVRLLNLRTVKPIDEFEVLEAVKEASLTVTVEDHFQTGGLYTILAELCLESRMNPRVLPIALPHRWFKPALLPAVLENEGFTGPQIAKRILTSFKGSTSNA